MKVRYTPRARSDLDSIFTYLHERSPSGACSVVAAVEASVSRLADFPLLAPETEKSDVRELPVVRYPYNVYYEVVGEEIWILHIRHARRRPWIGDLR